MDLSLRESLIMAERFIASILSTRFVRQPIRPSHPILFPLKHPIPISVFFVAVMRSRVSIFNHPGNPTIYRPGLIHYQTTWTTSGTAFIIRIASCSRRVVRQVQTRVRLAGLAGVTPRTYKLHLHRHGSGGSRFLPVDKPG